MTTTHIDVNVIDFDALGAWMDERGLPRGAFEGVAPVGGGTQNIMVRFVRGGVPYVLRRPPLHQRRLSNEVLRREARVLEALGPTSVAAPRLVAACPDENVLGGAVFYLMEPVNGVNPANGLPEPHASDPAIRYRMGLEAVAALAELGRVDHEAVGLAGFGRPEGFLDRQVPRWTAELESYASLPGYPGPRIPGLEETAAWLEANRPRSFTPGIMHGDYHLSNLMFAPDGPRVVAIVDWEMCTVGDPLLDLGWLLATWPGPDGVTMPQAEVAGLPPAGALVRYYSDLSERDLSAIDWYATMACFKLGIVTEGTHARACAGQAPRELGDRLHATSLALIERAHAFMAASADRA